MITDKQLQEMKELAEEFKGSTKKNEIEFILALEVHLENGCNKTSEKFLKYMLRKSKHEKSAALQQRKIDKINEKFVKADRDRLNRQKYIVGAFYVTLMEKINHFLKNSEKPEDIEIILKSLLFINMMAKIYLNEKDYELFKELTERKLSLPIKHKQNIEKIISEDFEKIKHEIKKLNMK